LSQGSHPRTRTPTPPGIFIAGIDFAGESEQLEDEILTRPGRDATVITIGELIPPTPPDAHPSIRVVEHYAWVGKKHSDLYPQMLDIMRMWGCTKVSCDATGIGEPLTSFFRKNLGPKVEAFKFTQSSKSQLGFDLLAAINSGRLKVYKQDSSEDYQELMFEMTKAKSVYRPNQTLNFFVDPSDGHDDFLMSLALLVHAAKEAIPRRAKGGLRED
jgi:hypothetical protein